MLFFDYYYVWAAKEKSWWGTIFLITLYSALWVLFGDLVRVVIVDPIQISIGVAVWIIIGFIWTVSETKIIFQRVKEKGKELRRELEENIEKEMEIRIRKYKSVNSPYSNKSPNKKEIATMERDIKNHYMSDLKHSMPKFRDIVKASSLAIVLWPFYIFLFFAEDIIVRTAKMVVHIFRKIYRNIYDKSVKEI